MMALLVDLTPCKPSMSSAESLALNMSGTWTNDILSKPLITQKLTAWRRGELEYSGGLKTRKLLKNREAENAVAAEIAPNWNVSGTRRKSNFKKRAFGIAKGIRAEGSSFGLSDLTWRPDSDKTSCAVGAPPGMKMGIAAQIVYFQSMLRPFHSGGLLGTWPTCEWGC